MYSKTVILYTQHRLSYDVVRLKLDSYEEEKLVASKNDVLVPEARQALNQMKLEIAKELGMPNYDKIDKGNLLSRQNGYVGGLMTRRLVKMAQEQMSQDQQS